MFMASDVARILQEGRRAALQVSLEQGRKRNGVGVGQQPASTVHQEAFRARRGDLVICTDFSFIITLPPTPLMGFSVGFFKTQLSLLCVWVFCLNIHLCATCVPSAHKTRTLGPLEQELQMTVSELGPLEKQTVLLNAEPSLQPSNKYFVLFLQGR